MKSLRFSKMMHLRGYRVVEYSNAGSESEADEKVVMLTKEEFDQFYPKQKPADFHGDYATIGERGWPTFNARLIRELLDRVKPGDFILHGFGRSHQEIVKIFPAVAHIENFIGYPDKPFGAFRIFESEAWRHYSWGRDEHDPSLRGDKGMTKPYTFVVPNFYDPADWPLGDGSGDYVVFMGRICAEKGMATIAEIIRADAGKTKFVFAGQGDFDQLIARAIVRSPNPFIGGVEPQVEFLGPITGARRAELLGKARCMILPSSYVEPFGGAGVESQLCGTPLIAQSWGCFTETVIHGLTGFTCNTLGDWLTAIDASKLLRRSAISQIAGSQFSLQTCAGMFDSAFRQIADLYNGPKPTGWYTRQSYRISGPAPQPTPMLEGESTASGA